MQPITAYVVHECPSDTRVLSCHSEMTVQDKGFFVQVLRQLVRDTLFYICYVVSRSTSEWEWMNRVSYYLVIFHKFFDTYIALYT